MAKKKSIIVKCGGILLRGKYGKSARRRTCLGFTLSITNPRWNALESTRTSTSMIRRYELLDVSLECILVHRIFMYWLYFRSGASFLLCMTVGWGGACFVICVKHDPWGILGTVSSHHIPTLLVLLQTQFLLFLKSVFPAEYICFR